MCLCADCTRSPAGSLCYVRFPFATPSYNMTYPMMMPTAHAHHPHAYRNHSYYHHAYILPYSFNDYMYVRDLIVLFFSFMIDANLYMYSPAVYSQ